MRRVLVPLTAAVLAAGALGVAAPAHAATTRFGNSCSAAASAQPDSTIIATAKGGADTLPLAAPQDGVITTVQLTYGADAAVTTRLKAVRATGTAQAYTVVGESAVLAVAKGAQSYGVRVPVQAGDLIGTGGAYALYCDGTEQAEQVAVVREDARLGSTSTYQPANGYGAPVVATIEPDADRDGYGDVTQDGCPGDAAVQGACPAARIDVLSIVGKRAVTVAVTSDRVTTASVAGKVKVRRKTVRLTGPAAAVSPGRFGTITVKLPRALRKALRTVPPTKKITATLTVSASNTAGAPTTQTITVKLPGTRR